MYTVVFYIGGWTLTSEPFATPEAAEAAVDEMVKLIPALRTRWEIGS